MTLTYAIQIIKESSGILRTGFKAGLYQRLPFFGLWFPHLSCIGAGALPGWPSDTSSSAPWLAELLSLFLGGCVSRAIDSWLLIPQPSLA